MTPRTRAVLHGMTCGVLVLASIALVWKTARREALTPSINKPVALTEFKNADERARRLHDVIGEFTTGDKPGDRKVVVSADGKVHFFIVGPLSEALGSSDTYTFGMLNAQTCLATPTSGLIRVLDFDRIEYFDDVYERAK